MVGVYEWGIYPVNSLVLSLWWAIVPRGTPKLGYTNAGFVDNSSRSWSIVKAVAAPDWVICVLSITSFAYKTSERKCSGSSAELG